LLPEGAPTTPDVGELVASVAHSGPGGDGTAYYVYADGRLIRMYTQADGRNGFVEQRLTPEGVERVRSAFLASDLFEGNATPSNVSDCSGICARDNDGRFLIVPGSLSTMAQAAELVASLRTLDTTLPETAWVARRVRTYVPARIVVCLQTFAAIPDRAIGVPLDLSAVVPTFPSRVAQLLQGRAPIGTLPNPDPACFETTLDEARTVADEFLSAAGGGLHQYSGIVVSNGQLAAIPREAGKGIVVYVAFNTLLPHDSAAAFGGR
jgi:hypothetical protein